MLETVKKSVNRKVKKSFNERFIDYMLTVQGESILLEMDYLKKHNKLDILKLDKWIYASFEEAIDL